MAFVDEMIVHMQAGKGGNGIVHWRHEIFKEFAGADGGNAGRGGNIYIEATHDVGALARYRNTKEFKAEDGQDGGGNSRQGAGGEDLVIELPVGSVITNIKSGYSTELTKVGEKKMILSGGRGGLGNEHFKSSTNTTPKEWTPGEKGEEGDFKIELHLIADAGLIGLPNAGKSSLLNSLTKAKAKIGAYQFTTLEPNLGELYGFIIADTPGLIEGASEGKGLGHKFLRHVNRTSLLLHCITLESDDISRDYRIIRKELEQYSKELAEKPEVIILTKTDAIDTSLLEAQVNEAKKLQPEVFTVSILDDQSVKNLSDSLVKLLRDK